VTRVRAAAAVLGAMFGFVISWGRFTDPDRIRDMLLLNDPYLYLMMATAIAVGFFGTQLLRRRGARALLTGQPVAWSTSKPAPRHIAGAAIFGLGWSIADSCPAPIAAQLTQGVAWSLFTIAGVVLGILGYLRWQERSLPARRTARRPRPAPAASSPGGAGSVARLAPRASERS
jgi:uncharacterized protein